MATTMIMTEHGERVTFSSYRHKYQMRESVDVISADGNVRTQLGEIIWIPKAPKDLRRWRCWGADWKECGTVGGEMSMKAARQVYVDKAHEELLLAIRERAERVETLVSKCTAAFKADGELGVLRIMADCNLRDLSEFQWSLKGKGDHFQGKSVAKQMLLFVGGPEIQTNV